MTIGARTRLSAEDRRDQLVALGLEMLATRRLDDVSAEEIAVAAGISKGLLFHYFGSKRGFHLAVAKAAAAELLARTTPDPELAPIDRLVRGIGQFVDYVRENSDAYVSLVSGGNRVDTDLAALFDATRQTNADRLVDALVELGAPDRPLLRMAARAWVAFVEEATVNALARGDITRAELVGFLERASIPFISIVIEDPVALQTVMDRIGPISGS